MNDLTFCLHLQNLEICIAQIKIWHHRMRFILRIYVLT